VDDRRPSLKCGYKIILKMAGITAVKSEETLSACSTPSAHDRVDQDFDQVQGLSFANDVRYAIRCDHDYAAWEHSGPESEDEDDEQELLTHNYVRDRDEAPFACSVIKEATEESKLMGAMAVAETREEEMRDESTMMAGVEEVSAKREEETVEEPVAELSALEDEIPAATEIPRIVKKSSNSQHAAFALQASGAFWLYHGLTEINNKIQVQLKSTATLRNRYLNLRRRIQRKGHRKKQLKTLFLLNVTFNECECETNLEEVVLEECLEACPRKRQVEAQIQELKRSLVEVQTKLENEARQTKDDDPHQ